MSPASWPSQTVRAKTGCGTLFVTVGPGRITCTLGKAGGCAACQVEGHARLATLALARGAGPADVAAELLGLRCHQSSELTRSCAHALGEVLRDLGVDTPAPPVA